MTSGTPHRRCRSRSILAKPRSCSFWLCECFMNLLSQFGDFYTLLFHRITFADSYCVIGKCVEVNRNTEWCADLILPSVTASDRPGNIPEAWEPFLQCVEYSPSFLHQFGFVLQERENGYLDWSYL